LAEIAKSRKPKAEGFCILSPGQILKNKALKFKVLSLHLCAFAVKKSGAKE
jgi:hypothetical protein